MDAPSKRRERHARPAAAYTRLLTAHRWPPEAADGERLHARMVDVSINVIGSRRSWRRRRAFGETPHDWAGAGRTYASAPPLATSTQRGVVFQVGHVGPPGRASTRCRKARRWSSAPAARTAVRGRAGLKRSDGTRPAPMRIATRPDPIRREVDQTRPSSSLAVQAIDRKPGRVSYQSTKVKPQTSGRSVRLLISRRNCT